MGVGRETHLVTLMAPPSKVLDKLATNFAGVTFARDQPLTFTLLDIVTIGNCIFSQNMEFYPNKCLPSLGSVYV